LGDFHKKQLKKELGKTAFIPLKKSVCLLLKNSAQNSKLFKFKTRKWHEDAKAQLRMQTPALKVTVFALKYAC
jgi:hypothetical protein